MIYTQLLKFEVLLLHEYREVTIFMIRFMCYKRSIHQVMLPNTIKCVLFLHMILHNSLFYSYERQKVNGNKVKLKKKEKKYYKYCNSLILFFD